MDSLGIRISSDGGGGRGGRGGGGGGSGALGQVTFSVEAKRSTLPQAIELLGEILREPAFPPAEFDTMKRRARTGSLGVKTDPAALASNRLTRALSPYSASDIRSNCLELTTRSNVSPHSRTGTTHCRSNPGRRKDGLPQIRRSQEARHHTRRRLYEISEPTTYRSKWMLDSHLQ